MEDEEVLIPGLPTELVLSNILPSIPWSGIRAAACLNRAWRSAIKCSTFSPLQRSPIIKQSSLGLRLLMPDSETGPIDLPPIPSSLNSNFAYENEVLYGLGGIDRLTGKFSRDVYAINVSQDSKAWVKCCSMTYARIGFGCVMAGGKIYVAGGEGEDGLFLTSVEVFDVKRRIWEPLPELPGRIKRGCKAAIFDDSLCILSGNDSLHVSHGAVNLFFVVCQVQYLKYGNEFWITECHPTKKLCDIKFLTEITLLGEGRKALGV